MALHNIQGRQGEEEATNYLMRQGYHILHRNWRCGHKELDIVAEKDATLIVVEVKTRKNSDYGAPQSAVSERKIRRIVASTDVYLRKYKIDLPVRFDIISLIGEPGNYQINHIQDAFLPPIW